MFSLGETVFFDYENWGHISYNKLKNLELKIVHIQAVATEKTITRHIEGKMLEDRIKTRLCTVRSPDGRETTIAVCRLRPQYKQYDEDQPTLEDDDL